MSDTQVATRDENSLAVLMERPEYKNRFNDVMGARAGQFMSSVLSLQMHSMRDVDARSILASAMTAASLDLPINPNLGFAYIVAYADKNRGGQKFAQFQMGFKGFIQLAIRTRQYRFLNACKVFEGELVRYDKLTGELVIDEEKKKSDTVVGFASFLRLTNGFEHALYMTVDQVTAHGKQYSQSFKKGYGLWVDNFEAMALKTLIKLLLSKWGVLSVQMEKALYEDQGVKLDINAEGRYLDNIEPIAAPQIGGPSPETPAPETPAAPAPETPAATTTPPAETTPPPKDKDKKKKKAPKLEVLPEPAKGDTPAAPAPTAETPHATEVAKRLNEAGHLRTDFLLIAVKNKWLDAPNDFEGDPADLEDMVIPEDKAEVFLEKDNWDLVLEQIAKAKAPPAE